MQYLEKANSEQIIIILVTRQQKQQNKIKK